MIKTILAPLLAASALLAASVGAGAQMKPMHGGMKSSMMHKTMSAMEHGMPTGTAGADGVPYTGKPDLGAAISLVTAGGTPGSFSITKALTSLAGGKVASAEVTKLTTQYGKGPVASFVAVQNYAVDDAVRIAQKAGVKFPAPTMHGKSLAATVVKLGLQDGTYYEGVQLDRLVTHNIHEQVMVDIDRKFGASADGNYHRIADQAHYDLAHALGMTDVKLAAYH